MDSMGKYRRMEWKMNPPSTKPNRTVWFMLKSMVFFINYFQFSGINEAQMRTHQFMRIKIEMLNA